MEQFLPYGMDRFYLKVESEFQRHWTKRKLPSKNIRIKMQATGL